MKAFKPIIIAATVYALAGAAHATLIDFEAYAQGTVIGTVVTGDNTVTFSTPTGSGLVVQSGAPAAGFSPDDNPVGGVFGNRFLTDETSLGGTFEGVGDYFLSFANAVSALSLQAADYRADGGGRVGDIITFAVFADAARTVLLGSQNYTITGTEADGNVLSFGLSGLGLIRGASLTSSGSDIGTAIDNIAFTTVPEPGTLSLLGAALFGLGMMRRRRRAA